MLPDQPAELRAERQAQPGVGHPHLPPVPLPAARRDLARRPEDGRVRLEYAAAERSLHRAAARAAPGAGGDRSDR